VENARGLGRHLAQWLVARGEAVVDVPSTATARVRELSRGGRRKDDTLDAAAAASVAALHGDAAPVAAEDATTVLAMLDERRLNLTQRTRTVNQLHALLRELPPGGAPPNLTASQAAAILARIRPASAAERTRKDLARDLVADVRLIDDRLKDNKQRMQDAVAESSSTLTDIVGVGPVVAAAARTHRPASRFPTSTAFAVYAGVAPIEIASADKARHRLSRQGDRKLNNALHTIALTQVRMHGSRGRVYYDCKIAEDKTHNEAMRCLKRRLADHVWRTMISDERAHAAGSGGHSGTTLQSSAASPTPSADSSDKSLPEPASSDPTT